MSIITRSDGLWTGPAVLTAISAAAQSAAQYTARVQADGGEIIDSAYVTDTFAFMIAQGISTHEFLVGSKLGIKREGSDVVKLYSLDGNDMVSAGNGEAGWYPQYDSTTYAYPVVSATQATHTLNNFRTRRLTRIQAGDGWGFAYAMRDDASDANIGSWQAYYPSGANAAPAGLIPFNGVADGFNPASQFAYAPRVGYTTGASQAETVACLRSIATGYVAFDGIAMHARQSTGVLKVWQNNVLTDTQTDASGFKNMRSEQLYLAFGYKEFSGLTRTYRQHQFAELWQVKNATEAQMQAISNRLGTTY